MSERVSDQADDDPSGLQTEPWQRVLKSALLYPVLREARFAVGDISPNGLGGESALRLGLNQQVHVCFDDQTYISGEVRWVNGWCFGFFMEDSLPVATNLPDNERAPSRIDRRDTQRPPVDLIATLVTSGPVLIGTIRNMANREMMIDTTGVEEGTRLIVKTRGQEVRMGHVASFSDGMAHVVFGQDPPEGSPRA